MNKLRGFTLIELILVIVILGFLVVIATSKYLDLSESAHASVFNTTSASFKAGIELLELKRKVAGSPNNILLNGQELAFDAEGAVVVDNVDDCGKLWDAVIGTSITYEKIEQSSVREYDGWIIDHFSASGYDFCQFYYTTGHQLLGVPQATFIYSQLDKEPVPKGFSIVDNRFN